MAFPSVAGVTETGFTSAGDPLVPFTQTTGDLVLIFLGLTSPQSITLSDSFTNLSNGGFNLHVFYKVLDGSEGGNVQVTLGTNVKAAAVAYNITGHHTTLTPAYISSVNGVGPGSGAPNPPTVSPGLGALDFLFIAGYCLYGVEEADDDTWANGAPTDYTNLRQVTSGTGGAASTNCMVATAERQLNAESENPGLFSAPDTDSSWTTYSVAVRPAQAAASLLIPARGFNHLIGR